MCYAEILMVPTSPQRPVGTVIHYPGCYKLTCQRSRPPQWRESPTPSVSQSSNGDINAVLQGDLL